MTLLELSTPAGPAALLPTAGQLQVIHGPDNLSPRVDIGIGPALLAAASRSTRAGWMRIYRPAATVAFSRRDTLSPGFPAAVELAQNHSFEPVLRAPGGRAAAYHGGALCLDLVVSADDPTSAAMRRFEDLSALLVGALQSLGVDAQVGELPAEYCPGRFSVHAQGMKLVGSAQRLAKSAWLLGAVILVEGGDPVRNVITDVYRALDQPLDVRTVGALEDLVGGVSVEDVESALWAQFERHAIPLTESPTLPWLHERAAAAAFDHPALPARASAQMSLGGSPVRV
ncbi:lipoate--protein ligase family protein [Georgenia soli]|uniref:lipoate--protein ligase family protein n=1 Tax=Georgenia soli TaxID=638953 RepID=UPI00117A15FC|nr:lipoate--protein ligase family protein [Georgenia soli]